jgi:acetyl-CoA carboxylase carboxyltransferase component
MFAPVFLFHSPDFRNEIRNAEDPDKVRQEKIEEYKQKFANPYVAAAYGYVDAVIEPQETRKMLIHALDISSSKSVIVPDKKHGVPPF